MPVLLVASNGNTYAIGYAGFAQYSASVTASMSLAAALSATVQPPQTASYTLTGPEVIRVATASTYTVTPSGAITGSVTITPSGAGLSTPIVLSWSGTSEAKTFNITPPTVGTITLTPTNSIGMDDPDPKLVDSQYADDFASYSLGGFPSGWSRFAAAGGPMQIVDGSSLSPAPTSSPPNCLGSAGATACRAWPNTFQAGSVSVSATMLNTSGLDADAGPGVFARVDNPALASFSGYAAVMRRSGGWYIRKYVSGTGSTLASVTSIPFVATGTRHLITLECQDSSLKLKVYAQSGLQVGKYLQTDGSWNAASAYCVTTTDSSYSSGYAGIIKQTPYTNLDHWDDILVQGAEGDVIPPSVSMTSPANGAEVSGLVTFSATASDNVGVQRVDFTVDGVVKASVLSAPYTADIQSAAWANGSHTVAAVAYDAAGNSASSSRTVTSSNETAITRPAIQHAQAHLKNFQLAYDSTPVPFSAEDEAVAPYVDVCVAGTGKVSILRALRPSMTLLIYSNAYVVNLGQLGDWITYARANGHDPEDGFWHAAQAYTFSAAGTGWHPPKKFWAMFSGSSSPWTDKRGPNNSASSVAFPGTSGQSLYMGQMDPWRELNVGTITVPPGGGWAHVIEYCSAVDGSGNPTAWSTLTTLSNTTSGFTTSGQILFNPPSNWVPCGIAGQVSFAGDTGLAVARLRYFYVRVRVTTSGTGPTTAELSARDYASSNYGSSGTIPAFDYAADSDDDGYLNDSQYANRTAGKDARFAYEGRIPSGYGVQRMLIRYDQPAPVAWLSAYHVAMMAANPSYNGIFVDNSSGRIGISQSFIIEPVASAATDYGLALNTVWRALPDHATMGQRWLTMNIAGSTDQAITDMLAFVPSYCNEFGYRAAGTTQSPATTWSSFEDLATRIALWQLQTTPEPIGVLDSDVVPDDAATMGDSSNQMEALCAYYMVASSGTYHMFWGGRDPSMSWRYKWTLAAQYNVGSPSGARSVWATGTDPDTSVAPNLTYKIYRRQYANALILLKPLSYASGVGTGVPGPASATTHSLTALNAAGYKQVQPDGTLGPTITSISMENGQGAILIPQ